MIEELASATEAPQALVEQIRAIFARRGVALDQDALPYLEVLEETFTRIALLEQDSIAARSAVARLEENSRRFADSCQELYGQLRSMDDFLKGPARLSGEEWAKRRKISRERAAARKKSQQGKEKPFYVILTPSDPE